MGDGVLRPVAMPEAPPESSMDFDSMDQLFLDGCWLETTMNGSDFPPNAFSTSSPLLDSSFSWPAWDTNGGLGVVPSHYVNQQGGQGPLFNESQEAPLNTPLISQDIINQSESENHSVEASEVVRRWWIGPTANPGPASSVMERLIRALLYIKEFNEDKGALIQIWVPVNREGRTILTTTDLPFSLKTWSPNLSKYREISEKYEFSAEEESKELAPGLPGRVFLGKLPEWTPDVQFFTSEEYPRVDHAQRYHVRGSLALPIFEHGSRTCLGVLEVVMTNQQIKYRRQLESVCKALEAVDLRSSKLSSMQNGKGWNKSYETAIPEIHEVLRCAYEMHKLPLSQTWVPCIQQGKEGCRHSDDNYLHCISPVEHACFVGDEVWGFHEACCEHHLLKGQGIAGGAFLTNQPCFSADVTSLGKSKYPLSHHARMFKLRAAVAIRLRSIHNTKDDFVLEFFLPLSCADSYEQKKMLTSLSMIIQMACKSLRVITDEELEEESNLLVDELIVPADNRSARTASRIEPKESGMVPLLNNEEKSIETMGRKSSDLRLQQEGSLMKGSLDCVGEFHTLGESSLSSVSISKTGEKRRAKAEKTITLEVLRQHFPGSLKDAAKNIGVCTTTLKRICRQHGIKRWPSRKIKKVGRSLQKLQLVIDSVQGSSGAFEIDSFYSNFAKLAPPNLLGTSPLSACNQSSQSDRQNPSSTLPEPNLLNTKAAASKSPSSSCSQSSVSSHSRSSESEQHPLTRNVAISKDAKTEEGPVDAVLKRFRSEAELKCTIQDRTELLPRSQSQEALGDDPKTEHYLALLKGSHKAPEKEDAHRVKITYGDEKARFRMPKTWRYEDLLQEIARRFYIIDMSKFDVKYLDDDLEWVLLTCDADLEECIDVGQSSGSSTIKLCLQLSNPCMRRSCGPS